jgi:hypothetical protein
MKLKLFDIFKKKYQKQYSYLISYHYKGGVGTVYHSTNFKVNTVENIKAVVKFLEEKTELENIGITNIIKLKHKIRGEFK